jgi:uncharacterized protein YjbI with pentapeptide repeats
VTPDPQGLKIRAAYITGRTDLADLRLPYGLSFNFCAFERAADWQRLTVTHLHLTHCQAPALILDEAKIDGMLNLVGLAATEVSADRAMIGDLNLQWVALFNEGGVALHLDGANIKGGASLSHSHVTGAVRARAATIGMQLTLQNANLTDDGGEALNLDGADIKGGAFLNPVTVTGEVRALGATIGHVLDLRGAALTNVGG